MMLSIELSEYEIEFLLRVLIKAQILANFITDFTEPELEYALNSPNSNIPWNLYVDGASGIYSIGLGIILTTHAGITLQASVCLEFQDTNNQAKYEAMLSGLQLVGGLGVQNISIFCDSQLIANQVLRTYNTRDEKLKAYKKLIW